LEILFGYLGNIMPFMTEKEKCKNVIPNSGNWPLKVRVLFDLHAILFACAILFAPTVVGFFEDCKINVVIKN